MTTPAPLLSAKPIIAMVHLEALPGTPANHQSLTQIEKRAVAEARMLQEAGVQALLVENMGDTPYLRARVGPEITAAMAVICRAVKAATGLPCGAQILAGANLEALAVAQAAGLNFIRVEGYSFAHVADEGLIQSSAAKLLRFRRAIGATSVQIWADIKKKHSAHAITTDVNITETAEAAEFMRADAVIVTGRVTGDAPSLNDVRLVKKGTRLPVLLGSGVTAHNLGRCMPMADGFIVGSEFKCDGHWAQPVDPKRVERFMAAYSKLKRSAR